MARGMATEEVPPSFLCPIMGDVMRDPVTCTDGHSYERANISRWLRENNTSPATGNQLASGLLIPNHALRNAIEDWEDQCARRRLSEPPLLLPSSASASAASPPSTTALVLATEDEAEPAPAPADAEHACDASPPPLEAGQAVLYTQSDGTQREVVVAAVHPGDADDPEPSYTISLDDGTERDTVRARLTPLLGRAPADEAASHAAQPPSTPASRDEAVQLAEEEARRAAVERSRLEARQARAERRMAAEAAAERQQQRHHNQQQWQPPGGGSGRGNPLEGFADGFRNLRRDVGDAFHADRPMHAPSQSRRQQPPPPRSDPLEDIGNAIGSAFAGAFEAIGNAAQGVARDLAGGTPGPDSQRRPPRSPPRASR